MNVPNVLRRRHLASADDAVEVPNASAFDVVRSTWSTKLVTAAILGCLAAGPLGFVLGGVALTASGTTAAAAPTKTIKPNDRTRVGEFAQRFVMTWLASTRDDSKALIAMLPTARAVQLGEKPLKVSNPAVVEVEQASDAWSVLVGVDVADDRTSTRRFFRVPVVLDGQVAAPVALPAPAPVPAGTAMVRPDYQTAVDPAGPVAETVEQFLAAFLTGNGDVTRYVSPDMTVAPVAPAPYTSVEVNEILASNDFTNTHPADGAHVRLNISANAVIDSDQSTPVAYALSLKARAGRWEIAAIDPVPELRSAGDNTAVDPPTTTPPSPSPSTTTSPTP